MNERRRFLQVVGGSAVAAGVGCGGNVASGPGGTPSSAASTGAGTGGSGAGGASGTGGAGGMTSTASSTTVASSSSGGNCGTGGAVNQGTNNDFCQSNKGRFALGKPSSYAAMGFHKTPSTTANVLLVRDAGGLYALSSLCPHQCCDMNATSPQGDYGSPTTIGGKPGYRCNCHGSRFRADGTVVQGPASQPLDPYELSLGCDGILYVDTAKVVPNTQRLMA